MRKLAAVAALSALVLAAAACGSDSDDPGGSGDVITLKYASNVPEAGSVEAGTRWWITELEKRSNGRVKVEAFYGGSLLGETEILRGVQDGVVDIGHVNAARHPEQFPLWSVAGVPFTGDNTEAGQRALATMYQQDENMRADFEKQGVMPLFFKPISPGVLGLKEPITKLSDLHGKRIRSLGGHGATALSALGAEPVDVNAPDVRESVERGTIDGWGEIPLETSVGLSLFEATKNYYDIGLGLFASISALMSLDTWNELPDDIQQLIETLNEEYYTESTKSLGEAEQAACDKLLAGGAKVTHLPQAELDAWKAQVLPGLTATWRDGAVKASGLSEQQVTAFYDGYVAAYQQGAAKAQYVNIAKECGA